MLQDELRQVKKRYWGPHLWAQGYFCARVDAVDELTIKRYIENQVLGNRVRTSRSTRQASLSRL
jgi:putative transposase